MKPNQLGLSARAIAYFQKLKNYALITLIQPATVFHKNQRQLK
jgi:hypothetical protein